MKNIRRKGNKYILHGLALCMAALLVFVCMPQAQARVTVCRTYEDVVEYLQPYLQKKETTITFNYDPSLYDCVNNNDWMTKLLYDVGISYGVWQYGATSCTIRQIEYMDAVHCATEGEVMAALTGVSGGSVNLFLSKELYPRLVNNNFQGLYDLEGRVGLIDRKMSYYDADYRMICYSEMEFVPLHTFLSTEAELTDYLMKRTKNQDAAFGFCCTAELFNKLSADSFSLMHDLEERNGISDREMVYNSRKKLLSYSKVQYQAGHFEFMDRVVYCTTENELINALRAVTGSSLGVEITPELYAKLSANDYARMNDIRGHAGLLDYDLDYYNNNLYIWQFTDLVFVDNFARLSNEEELKRYLAGRVDALDDRFGFYCTADLFSRLEKAQFAPLNDMLINLGHLDGDMTYYSSCRIITYENSEYFPGKRIVTAVRNGTVSQLGAQDKQLYQLAQSIVDEAKSVSRDDYELICRLHDAVTSRVVYEYGVESEKKTDNDTAVGALLNGRAECDGYADAFYLLGNLAGLEVYYQVGESREEEDDEIARHLWNIAVLDGKGYFVDLTWDDSKKYAHYGYTNIGRDIAQYCYTWDSSASLYTLTDKTNPDYYYYNREDCYFVSYSEASAYIHQQAEWGNSRFLLLLKHTEKDYSTAVDKLIDKLNVAANCTYSHIGNYVFFIIILK